ncbi:histidinol dehydrogenase [Clostridium aminobutyricum]|uniref:Histidinol dehydrogenase n=1 Tax=Clostridium aminobutyricum TaxID=33953 RepID=A0A939IJJ9_CLOAM|nr:histidinol dehydrogenase [Clostridium aminobutyricum]MBN7774176.1 histidinol dehydrogenase [Clostridium aminobutyricum]
MNYIKQSIPRDFSQQEELVNNVRNIINNIIENKDEALFQYNIKFDGNNRTDLRVSRAEIEEAYKLVEPSLIQDMEKAADNIRRFAEVQKNSIGAVDHFEVNQGVFLGHKIIPINSCCCYVPGGGYPLYSTALMLAIPAKVAGVKRIAACSPTMKGTEAIHPSTLVAMDIAGVDEIYALGGAHAIAAFSYGTEQIKPVDIIVGPGNQYVAEAKRQCYGQVGIDFVAGPSEVLIISESMGNAEFIAADILAQSEHDVQAKGILVTTDEGLGKQVLREVDNQLATLETQEKARIAWENNGEIILVDTIEEAYEISNEIAPEHLEIHVSDETKAMESLTNYGSLFIGENAAEVFGDYVSGTNHTLPTVRASRYTGGVYVGTFLKTCTYQKIDPSGISSIGQIAYNMAIGEGLYGHANAAKKRLK